MTQPDREKRPLAAVVDPALRVWIRVNQPVKAPSPLTPARTLWNRRSLLDLGALFLVVTAVLLWVVDFSTFNVPFVYEGDALGYDMTIKTMLETGWVNTTPRMGAPYGQQMYDMPLGGDNGNLLLLKALTLFTRSVGALSNSFWVLGFYVTAVAAWFVLRRLGVGRLVAIGATLLFDFATFHFARYAHIMLADYAVLAIAVLLGVQAAYGTSFSLKRGRRWATVGTLSGVVLLGSFGAYWAIFGILTIAIMCAGSALAFRTIRPLLHGALVGVGALAMLVVNELPTLLFQASHGANPVVVARQAVDLDAYGLRLVQLLTPYGSGHLQSSLVQKVATILGSGYGTEQTEFLGLVTAATFVVMVVVLFVRAVRGGGLGDDWIRPLLASTALAWVLIATTGGLSWFVWLGGFHDVRSWGRASILIMFLTLAWGGIGLTAWLQRRESTWDAPRRFGFALLASAIVAIGLAEQTPSNFGVNYDAYRAAYSSDQTYFASLEQALPRGSTVFDLPIRRFPEAPPTFGSKDYDLTEPFIHSSTLRFSYGGMKGREADWQQRLLPLPADQLVQATAAMGFQSILVDRNGYIDHGAAIESDLHRILGVAPLVSPNGRWATFPFANWLKTHTPSAALRANLVQTPVFDSAGCNWIAGRDPAMDQYDCIDKGTIRFVTSEPGQARSITVSLADPVGVGTVAITIGDTTTNVTVSPTPTSISLPLGTSIVASFAFSTDAPLITSDPSGPRFHLMVPVMPVVGAGSSPSGSVGH